MSFKFPDIFVGKQLFVGSACNLGAPIPPVGLGVGPTAIRGSAYLAGPVMIGSPITYTKGPNDNDANLMVARCGNLDAVPPPKSIFKVSSFGFPPTPIDVMLGDIAGPVGININSLVISISNQTSIIISSPNTNGYGILTWTGAKTLTGAEVIAAAKAAIGAEARSDAKVFNGTVNVNGILIASNIATPRIVAEYGAFSRVAAPFKQFDIPHPTRSGYRLVHTCLEGPEIGVYYRGKLENNNIIELPEYWRGLVDAESITVNLTPHNYYQELFVKSIEWGTRIIVQSNSGASINCSYVVYGKRKDVPDLEVEYEGTEMKGV